MRLKATTALAFFSAAATLGGCGDPPTSSPPLIRVSQSVHTPNTELLETAEVERRLLDRAWVEAADGALAKPTVVELPYAEWGGFLGSEPNARGFAFTGSEGQVVKVALTRPEPTESAVFVDGNIRAELFLVQPRDGALTHVRLAEIPAGEQALWFRLPAGASYVVRLQPEPVTDALYRFSVELEAALPFPVKGRADDAVGSLFGMPRDSGARHHEGIDIFAPRLTPVVAVADGRATPRENELGGNTIWLSTPGTSYYYAHLDRATVSSGQRVRAGEVIGYVGNSGNAATTDPHLHFGIYRWGRGAVDPFPLLQARRFAEPPAGLPDSRLVQASLRRTCASAPRVRNVAAYGCALRIGAAIDGLSAVEAADCLARDARELPLQGGEANRELPGTSTRTLENRESPSSAFEWHAAAPLSVDDGTAIVVPVDFDAAGAVFEMPADEAGGSLLACELASTTAAASDRSPLRAGLQQHRRVMAF
jgi:murein DD-endopeptidase MepM/ murein hydrolase activator NlpD